jgi:hypothetical protein
MYLIMSLWEIVLSSKSIKFRNLATISYDDIGAF